uniref:Uncharacterized protein n=1 Tax=Globodera rostochiensis TaxID=31243 RepID=A0A914GRP0_GLORO
MVGALLEHFIAGNAPPSKAKKFHDVNMILSILHRYLNAKAALPQLQDDHQYIQNQITPHLIVEVLTVNIPSKSTKRERPHLYNWTVDNPTVDNWTVDNPTVRTIRQKWTIGQWTIQQ